MAGVGFDSEDGIPVGDGCEVGCGSVAIRGDVGASPWHLLDVALEDRWTLGYGYLDELNGSASSPAQDCAPVSGAYVLDPVATIAKHGHEKPLSLPVGHAEREPGRAATVASTDFEGYPTTRHETHPLHGSPKRANRRAEKATPKSSSATARRPSR